MQSPVLPLSFWIFQYFFLTEHSLVSCAVTLATTAVLPSWSKGSVIEVSGCSKGL